MSFVMTRATRKKSINMTSQLFFYNLVILLSLLAGPMYRCTYTKHFFSQNWKK